MKECVGLEGTTGSKSLSKRACFVSTSSFFFLQLTWFFQIDGMVDASPANAVRGDVSNLHMFVGLEGTDGPSKCSWFFRRTGAMKCHGFVFSPTDGQEARPCQSLKEHAHRDTAQFFQSRQWLKKTENDEQAP